MSKANADIEALIDLMARLPGLGPRSARRAVLHMIKKRALLMTPLADVLQNVAATRARMPDLRQYCRIGYLRYLRQRQARHGRDLRGRRRRRPLGDGARFRLQGPLSRVGWYPVRPRRGRTRRPRYSAPDRARRCGKHHRGYPRCRGHCRWPDHRTLYFGRA